MFAGTNDRDAAKSLATQIKILSQKDFTPRQKQDIEEVVES